MTSPLTVLVVDDNPDALELVGAELTAAGYSVSTAGDGVEGWARFRSQRPDLVVSDVRMPKQDGFELLRKIREVSDAPVIMLTAHADVPAAVAALRAGATDFLCFPDQIGQLGPRARALLPERDTEEARDAASALISGDAPSVRDLRARVRSLAALDVPVLVTGEAGSGRRQVVAALHTLAKDLGPLFEVSANSSALPKKRSALLLSGLEACCGELQDFWAATLRAPEAAQISRVFAVATSQLSTRVEHLDFRRDLWQRLSRFRLEAPPLRARSQDIPALAREALREIAEALGRPEITLTPGAVDSLRRMPWPGNLPELRDVLEQAVAFGQGARVDREEIERAVEWVIANREDSLSNRRAGRHNADRQRLIELLDACGGNIAEMGRRLNLTRGAVAYRLKKHGLAR